MELSEFLAWLVGGGGAAAVAYFLMERLPLGNLSSEWRRYLSLVLAAVTACAAFGVTVALGYAETPADAKAWIEALFSIIAVSIGGSQALHGRLKL